MIVTPCELRSLYIKEIVLIHAYTLMVIIYSGNCACIKDPSKEGTRPSKKASSVKKTPRCARDGPGWIQDSLRRCSRDPTSQPRETRGVKEKPGDLPDAQVNSQDAPKRARDAPRIAEDKPKRVPRQPRRSHMAPQKHPRSSYMGPKTAQKKPHGTPKAPQKHPKESNAR